jgi:hypothetical protein
MIFSYPIYLHLSLGTQLFGLSESEITFGEDSNRPVGNTILQTALGENDEHSGKITSNKLQKGQKISAI